MYASVCANPQWRSHPERRAQIASTAYNRYFSGMDTLYKTKDKKVQPVDLEAGTGETPRGDRNWKSRRIAQVIQKVRSINDKEKGPYSQWIVPRFTNLPVKVRLTQERKERINVGKLLTCKELNVFFSILSNREAALA